MNKKLLTITALAAAALLSFSGCGTTPASPAGSADASTAAADPNALGSQANPIKVGVISAPEPQHEWLKTELAKEGVYLEFVNFTDYQQPNPATSTGEVHINQFQHVLFLAQYNVESGNRLEALASTAIYPLGLYSVKYKSVAEIPEGSQIAIPNDETNQARAISVLASAGLLVVKDGVAPLYATPLDIDEAASKVKVVPVQADQTPRQLDSPDIAAAIANNNWAQDAGFDPSEAIAKDDPSAPGAKPYVNVWAGPAALLEKPAVKRLLELAKTEEFNKLLLDQSKGSGVVVDEPYAELVKDLAEVEEQIKNKA
ncbi:MAG: methionine ABC transporter substrate-binding protein [Propionibacteriaceae bacterium]|jgi:D-methionine transport system substrate-binding protein|nr:methionine ABC transporter substrate-binding protein [Propionibacteriaceae bacterium]